MNQHDDQPGEQHGEAPKATGDTPDSEPSSGPAEHDSHNHAEEPWSTEDRVGEDQSDIAEHEAAVPSSTEDSPPEDQPDLAEHESTVPPSAGDASPEATEHASTPSTGDDRVDEALTRLAELDRLDVTEHAGVVEDVHRALQDTLAEDED